MFQPAYQPFPPASFAYEKSLEHSGRDPEKRPGAAEGSRF